MTEKQLTYDFQPETLERFESRRQETGDEHTPPMTADVFLHSLLDTLEAAESGYYAEVSG